jgi:hypothetical protein
VTVWVPPGEALETEGLVVAVGRRTLTRLLEVLAGAAAALPIRMSSPGGRRPHGVPRKRLIHTRRVAERHLTRVPKPQIRTPRKAAERRVGVHLLGRQIPMGLPLRTKVLLHQVGAVRHPVGEELRQSRRLLGTITRLHRVIMAGSVQDHPHREDGPSPAG